MPSTPAARSRVRSLLGQLWFQVIVAAVPGIAVGFAFPKAGPETAQRLGSSRW
ncbi:hypothetical protein [Amycolatopsis sp. FDAARGOS 1241]|uniref:hypothetical protein n=1 Tax=Amycolatopsis sp. FDAARGOS 1241 TaxID=2778070 RepID=UPI001951ECBA|nr:hypothetical protein [Amycolatopsis sp. FDAARGOS 1241]QRP50212.1 hypothetical protein I6J71_22455 [Amycolatopsis sp. FDAARGOS 1241]